MLNGRIINTVLRLRTARQPEPVELRRREGGDRGVLRDHRPRDHEVRRHGERDRAGRAHAPHGRCDAGDRGDHGPEGRRRASSTSSIPPTSPRSSPGSPATTPRTCTAMVFRVGGRSVWVMQGWHSAAVVKAKGRWDPNDDWQGAQARARQGQERDHERRVRGRAVSLSGLRTAALTAVRSLLMNVLFVCHANTSRSIMAETLLRSMIEERGSESIRSRFTPPASPPTRATARWSRSIRASRCATMGSSSPTRRPRPT